MIRSNRFALLALVVFAALSFLFLGPYKGQLPNAASIVHDVQQSRSSGGSQTLLTGHAIAPKLGNATAKYVLVLKDGHTNTAANGVRTGQNSAAQHGSLCTRPSLDFRRNLQTRRRKHCDNMSTFSSDCTHAESAPSILVRFSRSTRHRSLHRRLPLSGAVLYTTLSTNG